jgi:hypothetical protein
MLLYACPFLVPVPRQSYRLNKSGGDDVGELGELLEVLVSLAGDL